MQRVIRSATQSWRVDLAMLARLGAAEIASHTGKDGTIGGLKPPAGIAKKCDTMEVWGSEVDPITHARGPAVVWGLVFTQGGKVVATVERPDPPLPKAK